METVILIIVIAFLLSASSGMSVYAFLSVQRSRVSTDAKFKAVSDTLSSQTRLIAKLEGRLEKLEEKIRELDTRSGRIAEDRRKIPAVSGRPSFSRFAQQIRDDVDQKLIKGNL